MENTRKTWRDIQEKARELLEDAYNRGDVDAMAVYEGGFEEAFVDLWADCYTWEQFCTWLIEHDLDIAQDFRFAEVRTFEEIIQEVDEGNDNPGGTYELNTDEWETLTTEEKKERIIEAADALLIGKSSLCVSW